MANETKTDEEILEALNLEPDTSDSSTDEKPKDNEKSDLDNELESLYNAELDEIDELDSISELEILDDEKSLSESKSDLENEKVDDVKIENRDEEEKKEEGKEEEKNDSDTSPQGLKEEEYKVQKKQSNIRKVMIGIIGFLLLILIIGATLFFLGFFDSEPVKPKLTQKELQKQKEARLAKIEEENKYNFKQKDIDVKRLNKKLNLLTKYEIIESDNKEKLKDEEKERLYKLSKEEQEEERQLQISKIKAQEELRMKEMIEAAKAEAKAELLAQQLKDEEEMQSLQTEEALKKKKREENNVTLPEYKPSSEETDTATNEIKEENDSESKPVTDETSMNETNSEEMQSVNENNAPEIVEEKRTYELESKEVQDEMKKNQTANSFLKFISIETNQLDIYKSYLNKVEAIDRNIILCRDNKNLVEIVIGPFTENENRDLILEEFINNGINPQAVDFTQEEYDKRCNY